MNYLIEANIVFSVFFLVYVLIIRRLTHFTWNRVYLILSLLISALAPFVSIPVGNSVEYVPSVLLPMISVGQLASETGSKIPLSWGFYWSGVAVAMIWLGLSVARIVQLSRRSVEKEYLSDSYLASEGNHAFSFFTSTLIGNRINDDLRAMIIGHESVHQRQWHSVDVIAYALARVFFWFNPMVHWAASEVSANHEYLADDGSLRTFGTDYQYSLLNQALDTQVFNLSNSFYKKSLIKNRIMMMNKKRSSGWSKAAYALMIPLAAGLLWITSCSESGLPSEVQKDGTLNEALRPSQPEVVDDLKSLDKLPSFPDGQEGMIKFFQEGFSYPEELKADGVEGTVYISFIVNEDGSCSEFEVAKSADERLEGPAIAFLEKMPEWEPGIRDEEAVKVKMTLPIKYALN